jgi:hypothetical protein
MSSDNNTIQEDKVYINDLISKINNIVKASNKNDFIKNYNEYHKKIKQVDDILYMPNTIDPNIDIKTLFEMLKKYDLLLDNNDISTEEYKNMLNLIETIEQKIKSSNFEIKEV